MWKWARTKKWRKTRYHQPLHHNSTYDGNGLHLVEGKLGLNVVNPSSFSFPKCCLHKHIKTIGLFMSTIENIFKKRHELVPSMFIFVVFFLYLIIILKFQNLVLKSLEIKGQHVWFAMTTSIKVWTPYLDRIMSTKSLLCKWKDHLKLFTYHLKSNFSNNECNDILHHIMHVSMYVHYHVHISKVEYQMN
jgi:hypothetical protein